METQGEDKEKTNDTPETSNATDESEDSTLDSVSTWLTGWYNTAKKKVVETNEFMKRDLQEFSQAVQTDASKLVSATATTMKEKLHINVDLEEASSTTRSVTNSLSNFLGNIANKVGPILPDDDENEDSGAIMGTSSGTKVLSPSEARIFAIRTDPATFCNEPDNEEEYFMWLPGFNVEQKKSEISTLMLDCSQVRSLYTKLVPSAVSHSDFWGRYFFKLHQHIKAEERRAMLMERAHKSHDDIEWDDEDDDATQTRPSKQTPVVDDQVHLPVHEPCENPPQNSNGIPATVSDERESKTPEADSPLQNTPIPYKTEALLPSAQELKSSGDDEEMESRAKDDLVSKTEDLNTTEEKITEEVTVETETAMKTPSTGESSDSWEKDFDLDMTEDEIKQALQESEAADVSIDDIGDDWDEWE